MRLLYLSPLPLLAFTVAASSLDEAQEQQPFTFGAMAPPPYTLPPLPYAYDALEPHISGQIMKLHHTGHHKAYVTNLNAALESYTSATQSGDLTTQLNLQPAIRFNAGGHINHSLFWPGLCPANSASAKTSAAPELIKEIKRTWGSEEEFKKAFNKELLGIKGSGWGWLVKVEGGSQGSGEKGRRLHIETTKDQEPVVGEGTIPVFGVDMWEHAYYLQYLNGKAAYVDNIWKVINWKMAEERYLGSRDDVFKDLKKTFKE
jgi:Fe-Mn family superoxide dismutase